MAFAREGEYENVNTVLARRRRALSAPRAHQERTLHSVAHYVQAARDPEMSESLAGPMQLACAAEGRG